MQGKQLAKVSTIALGVVLAVGLGYVSRLIRHRGGNASTGQDGQVLCCVIQLVGDNGWRTYGKIVVASDGYYRWTRYGLSKAGRAPETKEGRLPGGLLKALADDVSKGRFEIVGGEPTYQYDIDNWQVKHPSAVEKLLGFLYRTHVRHGNEWRIPVFTLAQLLGLVTGVCLLLRWFALASTQSAEVLGCVVLGLDYSAHNSTIQH